MQRSPGHLIQALHINQGTKPDQATVNLWTAERTTECMGLFGCPIKPKPASNRLAPLRHFISAPSASISGPGFTPIVNANVR